MEKNYNSNGSKFSELDLVVCCRSYLLVINPRQACTNWVDLR
jgi:hypothetical protein